MVRQVLRVARFETPTGRMIAVTDPEEHLRALDWEDFEPRLQRLLRRYHSHAAFELVEGSRPLCTLRALDAYFAGDLSALDALRTASGGSDFQRSVWTALRTISIGTTTTYGALASKIGRPAAVRAVGAANGANPIALVVPCHRVIGKDASLTGYAGGLARKRWLLTHEGAL